MIYTLSLPGVYIIGFNRSHITYIHEARGVLLNKSKKARWRNVTCRNPKEMLSTKVPSMTTYYYEKKSKKEMNFE